MWIISTCLLLTVVPVHCLESKANNVKVVNDIWNAFRAVTNDSALLDHILPEMYGPSMRNANPTFVFQMPTSDRDNFQMLTMQRSDFAEPIFPNITKRPNIVADALQTPPDIDTYVKSSQVLAPSGEWHQLGLEGWAGELKTPLPWQEQSHK